MGDSAALTELDRQDPWADFDDAQWRRRMQKSDVADELFIPLVHGEWKKARFRLVRGEASQAKARNTGVRFLAADPQRQNLEPERAVQTDLHRLVDSLIKLRQEPGLAGLCLSGETFCTSVRGSIPRRQFGISRAAHGTAIPDTECAQRSYRTIRSAIRRAGFVVVDPKEKFDPSTGLAGLRDWVDQVRLRKRSLWPLWLLLLPLLLLLLLLPRCESPAEFFGVPVETRSYLLLIDRSTSMVPHFEALRNEAQRLLEEMSKGGEVHANAVSYCGHAESCLGGIERIDETNKPKLEQFLRDLQPSGGTALVTAIEIASKEIREHNRPTTLIILTDAEDGSIPALTGDRAGTLGRFGGVEIHSIALTPRLFGPQTGPANPVDANEQRFADLAGMLGGQFGAPKEKR